jgi:hypothetical protein
MALRFVYSDYVYMCFTKYWVQTVHGGKLLIHKMPPLYICPTNKVWSGKNVKTLGPRDGDAKTQVSSPKDARPLGGYGGILPQNIVKFRDSERPFRAVYIGEVLSNPDGPETT